MPVIKRTNNLYMIKDIRIDYDDNKQYYLTMNPGKSAACVICVSKNRPVTWEDLSLDEPQLASLLNGGEIAFPEKGYTLRGITRPQIAASPQVRDFTMAPPCHVQVWGLSGRGLGDIELHLPENPQDQYVLVPVEYRAQWDGNTLTVWTRTSEGYQDGDLMYQVADHKPIPIPGDYLNVPIPLRPGSDPVVMPARGKQDIYRAV